MMDKFVFALKPEENEDFLRHAEAVELGDEDCIITTKTRLATFVTLTFVPAKKKEENQQPQNP